MASALILPAGELNDTNCFGQYGATEIRKWLYIDLDSAPFVTSYLDLPHFVVRIVIRHCLEMTKISELFGRLAIESLNTHSLYSLDFFL